MEKRNIVNVVNFIRGAEPRIPGFDLVTPVKEQISLLKELGLKGTFLLQYDALTEPVFKEMLLAEGDRFEVGAWFESVESLCAAAGVAWRGREGFSWDWFAGVSMLAGYSPEEREKLTDAYMAEFKSTFGRYPASAGSWVLDAHSVAYMQKKYGVKAFCNCKEQYGTDGYTLWGGYYNGGYYPSVNNALMPAQTEEKQIPAPVFRMLGIDPVSQYDFGMSAEGGAPKLQGVITLEPAYTGAEGGGGVPSWVDWYFAKMFGGNCLTYAYAQAGQENSFGWDAMKDGLTYQFKKLAELQKEGRAEVLTLEETGEWFSKSFSLTPPSAIVCDTNWNDGKKSFWYNCKNYRVNLFCEENTLRIRDFYVFDENFEESYLRGVCGGNYAEYINLPVMDGNRWSGGGVLAGIFFETAAGEPVRFTETGYAEDGLSARFLFHTEQFGKIEVRAEESGLKISAEKRAEELILHFCRNEENADARMAAEEGKIAFAYRGFSYALALENMRFDGEKIALCGKTGALGIKGEKR